MEEIGYLLIVLGLVLVNWSNQSRLNKIEKKLKELEIDKIGEYE